jgi:hypothetical protein
MIIKKTEIIDIKFEDLLLLHNIESKINEIEYNEDNFVCKVYSDPYKWKEDIILSKNNNYKIEKYYDRAKLRMGFKILSTKEILMIRLYTIKLLDKTSQLDFEFIINPQSEHELP